MGILGAVLSAAGASGDLKSKLKGRNPDQQQIIHYFCDERGCLKKGVPDSEFDANKERQIAALNLKKKALGKLGIDEDQVKEVDPIMLEGPVYKDTYKMRGADNIRRYSGYQITYIFCSSDQVYVYQYTIHLDSDEKKERAEEYFYKDITNFTTVDDTEEFDFEVTKGSGCLAKTEEQKIKVDTAEFKIVVPGDAFLCSMIPNDETEGKIQALKAKLREKKNA